MARSVVVTGSGKGIGRAIAEHLTADGWMVVGLERTAESGTLEAGICQAVVLGDSAERSTHRRAAEAARGLAPLAGWVNNAGITKATPLHELDEALVRQIVDINGLGYLWGCSAAVSAFIAQKSGGSIVNIGSIHGRASYVDRAAYEFTKGGIDALSRSVAVTYGPYGIRANTLAPGVVRTPHLEAHLAASSDPVEEERSLTAGPPMRRIGRPGEIAAAVSFLLSDASGYISGQSIAADGGWTAAFGTPRPDERLHRLYGLGLA